MLLFRFIVPFLLLLSGRVKRDPRRLAAIALLVLFADLMHLYWLVAPTYSANQFRIHWLDFAMPLLLGGLWLAAFVWQLRRRVPVMPAQEAA